MVLLVIMSTVVLCCMQQLSSASSITISTAATAREWSSTVEINGSAVEVTRISTTLDLRWFSLSGERMRSMKWRGVRILTVQFSFTRISCSQAFTSSLVKQLSVYSHIWDTETSSGVILKLMRRQTPAASWSWDLLIAVVARNLKNVWNTFRLSNHMFTFFTLLLNFNNKMPIICIIKFLVLTLCQLDVLKNMSVLSPKLRTGYRN